MKFYRVKFPTDTLWVPWNDIVKEAEVKTTLYGEMKKFIDDNIEIVEVDPNTRAVVTQSAEVSGREPE